MERFTLATEFKIKTLEWSVDYDVSVILFQFKHKEAFNGTFFHFFFFFLCASRIFLMWTITVVLTQSLNDFKAFFLFSRVEFQIYLRF